MSRRPRHQRNRACRPSLPHFGSAPVTIVDAWQPAANSTVIAVLFSEPVVINDPTPVTNWRNFTAAENAVLILNGDNAVLWPQYEGRILALGFVSNENRIGDTFGWNGHPGNITAFGLPFADDSRIVIREGAIS